MSKSTKTVETVAHTHTYIFINKNILLNYIEIHNFIKHLYKHKAIFPYAFLKNSKMYV